MPQGVPRFFFFLRIPRILAQEIRLRCEPPPLPEMDEDGEEYYQYDRILDHRFVKKGRKTTREYLIRWTGYGVEWDSWEPEKHITENDGGNTLHKYWDYLGLETPMELEQD